MYQTFILSRLQHDVFCAYYCGDETSTRHLGRQGRLDTMGRQGNIPSMSELEQWLRSGLTPKECSVQYAARGIYVTPGAIAIARHRHGWPRVNMDHSMLIPWRIRPEHRRLFDHRMLTEESARRQGKQLTREYEKLVDSWKAKLAEADCVIHYQPDTMEGWWRVSRRHGVDNDLIREPSMEDEEAGLSLRR